MHFQKIEINECINDIYYDEVKENRVKVLAPPKMNDAQSDIEKTLIYELEVAIVPEFTLAKYKGLELKKVK